jgi:phage terminase large subunit GpA-like protein
MYYRGALGRLVILAADGPHWRRMFLRCPHCRYRVPVPRADVEARLAGSEVRPIR